MKFPLMAPLSWYSISDLKAEVKKEWPKSRRRKRNQIPRGAERILMWRQGVEAGNKPARDARERRGR